MIRQKLTVGLVASAFTLSLSPAWAGQRDRPAGAETVGSAVPRDSGGGGSSSSAPSGGSSDGSTSSNGGSNWMGSSPSSQPQAAPRSERVAEQHRSGGSGGGSGQRSGSGGGGERAVPRGSAATSGSTSSSAGSNGNQRADGNNRVDSGTARPRDGRQPVGTAVERRGPAPGHGGGVYYPGVIYDPYYSYYYDPFYYGSRYSSYWSPYGYGFGLGYFAYDPFLFGGYGSYSGAYGNGAYGYDPYQGAGSGGYGGSSGSGYRGVGSLRLKVKPADAQVYVDGYFMGVVDSFDGSFQKLTIEEGAHKVEVRSEGYTPVQFDVMVIPGETITYKGELPKIH